MDVKTYPEMNAKIVGLLRICDDNPTMLYAAQRIEELERAVATEREHCAAIAHGFLNSDHAGHIKTCPRCYVVSLIETAIRTQGNVP